MTDALAQINDRLADAARAAGSRGFIVFCECGDCLAEEVPLSLDEHAELRAREDLVFAPGHDAPRRYRQPSLAGRRPASAPGEVALGDSERRRASLVHALARAALLPRLDSRFS
jgi:hypothetical protein